MCDRCTRVVCHNHTPMPEGTDLRNTIFLCVACHLRVFSGPVPYYVSFYFLGAIFVILFIIVAARDFIKATALFCPSRRNLGCLP